MRAHLHTQCRHMRAHLHMRAHTVEAHGKNCRLIQICRHGASPHAKMREKPGKPVGAPGRPGVGVWKSCVHLWDRSDYLSPHPGQRYTVQFSDPGQRTFRNTHANEGELEEYAQKFERAERARVERSSAQGRAGGSSLPRGARRGARAGGPLLAFGAHRDSLSDP